MAKQTNTKSSSKATVPVSAPAVVAPVQTPDISPAPVKVVSKKTTKTTKVDTSSPVDLTSVVPAVPVGTVNNMTIQSEPVVNVVVDTVVPVESSVSVKLNLFGAKLQQITSLLSNIKSDYKVLEKVVNRELKNAQKSSRKKKYSANRQPSGFVRPTRISDELANFLGKTIGVEMARTDVSKEINSYIRSNNLQDKVNGRKIIADNKLATLLKLGSEDELTYFNLQRYMKHHFIKAEPVVAVDAAATATA